MSSLSSIKTWMMTENRILALRTIPVDWSLKRFLFFILIFCLLPNVHSFAAQDLTTLSSSENQIIYKRVRLVLEGKGDYFKSAVKRLGNRTMELECFTSMEADARILPQLLSDFEHYKNWVFNGFNVRPDGGDYYSKILKLTPDPGDPSMITVDLSMDFPFFHKKFRRRFKLSLKKENAVLTLKGNILPVEDSIFQNAKGSMIFYPVKGSSSRVWVYFRGSMVIESWLLYEFMPERILNRITAERLPIILENYLDEESQYKKGRKNKEKLKISDGTQVK